MTIPDSINGLFEAVGGVLNWMNVYRLYKDKEVKGVFPLVWVFFASWGLWNLFYYRHLDQFMSWYGGMFLVSANITWVILAFYYQYKNSHDNREYL